MNINNIQELLTRYTVVVPKIQRDYAQGRKLANETKIRNNLLDSVFTVIKGETDSPLRLNYIYGIPHKNEIVSIDGHDARQQKIEIVLIDGQQRITTLYLLWLFLAYNAGHPITDVKISYESRTTSKDFCEFLIGQNDILECSKTSVSKRAKNNKEFFKKWLNDPTIDGMLNMLDAINEKAYRDNISNYQFCLDNLANVQFSFISLDGFKREEELYAVMNGRGRQLTPFEILKPTLIQRTKNIVDLSGVINENWIPAFWKYSATRDSDYKLVENKHDEYLYNFYTFVVSMLYAQKEVFEKGQEFPKKEVLNHWLLDNPSIRREEIKFLVFAMDNFENMLLIPADPFAEIVEEYNTSSDKVYIEGINKEKIIDNCCDSCMSLLQRCIFWAFLKYKYDNRKEASDSGDIKKYYRLMRDLYTESWDINTPLSITKNPAAYLVANKTIKKFDEIVSGKDKVSLQASVYIKSDAPIISILNNPLTRGRSNNLRHVILNKNDKEKSQFGDNLNFLYEGKGEEAFDMLSDIGYEKFIYSKSGYSERKFIPWSENFFKSLLSMGCWTEESWYTKLLDKLCEKKLSSGSSKQYLKMNWQYYVKKYPAFCFGNTYSAFDCSGSDIDFAANAVYGAKATKNQIASAFLYAAYCKKFRSNSTGKTYVKEYKAYEENHNMKIHSSCSKWYLDYDGQRYEWNKNGSEDFVEFIEDYFI